MNVLLLILLILPVTIIGKSPDDLPFSGKWKGVQHCMEMPAKNNNEGVKRDLTLIIRGNEIYNEYTPPKPAETSSMFASSDPTAGLTSDDPNLIRSMVSLKIFSKSGRKMLKRLADVLRIKPKNLTTYSFKPNKDVVKGKMFCDPNDSWCHSQATKRVSFEGKLYEVESSDMMKMYGHSLVRVGYTIDKIGCAPKTCTYVCQAQLNPVP